MRFHFVGIGNDGYEVFTAYSVEVSSPSIEIERPRMRMAPPVTLALHTARITPGRYEDWERDDV